MDTFIKFAEALFAWLADNIGLLAIIAFFYWLICGYVRWCRRFDRFGANLIHTLADIHLLICGGNEIAALRLYNELIYSPDLLIFTNSERAKFILFSEKLIGAKGDRLREVQREIADHCGKCHTPFRHLIQCPGEFLKTLFHAS